jgi:hypothetical protein
MKTSIKIGGSSLAMLLFIGAWGASSNALGADRNAPGEEGVLLKQEYVLDSYCHEKLPAISESSLAGDHPVPNQSDVIDFYGPCNENALGKDQVQEQRRAATDRRSR